MKIHHL